jgi:hypothetical protein
MAEYGKWHLGIDETLDVANTGRYKVPYGEFEKVHRCGLLAAESRAGQRKYHDVELAVAHLHGLLALRRTAHASNISRRGLADGAPDPVH